MPRVFAPGVIKLFGEHAVVYGKPAIAATIDKGVHVECVRGERLEVVTVAPPASVRYIPGERRFDAFGLERFFAYVDAALRVGEERWGSVSARFTITSDLPPSVGAATSAAVAVGLLKAYAACAGVDVGGEELAKLGHRVELEVQGIASPMDTAAVSIGGVLKIWASPFRAERLEVQLPQLYVAVLPRRGTTGEIVADVRALLGRRPSARAVLDAIGAVVDEAEVCLRQGDLVCLGELMYINNWLLGALGVVDSRAVSLLETLRPFIYGGKISGAGRGGVVLLLPRDADAVEKALYAMGQTYIKVSLFASGATLV
ncbi:mevalonate kinase [Pyrobaculum neutrophilum]|uniref:Mevalonate kinase n=1 Tax=Pyrobaculum neutrophilum (strain DSM 2338 / JCM 9278 / NBRC 100436 / V24Sta) TaxID=444157 RepID=B1YAC6_PYRNV|nr:mevalonate kinase [Pyrobaculum neutrophilum]ACB40575.1 mevalonate kinase [Pyrobaculum neutrophilum V24Sta]